MNQSTLLTKETNSMHPLWRIFIVAALFIALGMSFWLIWIDHNRIVPIVMYHHIDKLGVHEVTTIPTERFEEHLKYLKKHRFNVLSLEELVGAIKNKKKLSRKSVVLTFDDGYQDNYTNAYPLLKKYGFTATMFICPDIIGQPGFMEWDQIREMQTNGIKIGSHTKSNKYLPDLSDQELVEEIVNSRKLLEQKLGNKIAVFSYPVGGFNQDIKGLVKKAGYQGAVSTNRGYDRYNQDVFELNRVTIDEDDNFGAIRWAKFSGYYNLFRKPRKPE